MNYLVLAKESNWSWAVDIFTFIGMAVSAVISLIALVWLTCFVVKLLVKTFGVRVGKSYEIMVEDITKKAEAKKVRKETKRQQAFAQKQEILNMKLESKARVHEMKKQKLAGTLAEKEKEESVKILGQEVEIELPKKVETPKPEVTEPQTEEKNQEIQVENASQTPEKPAKTKKKSNK